MALFVLILGSVVGLISGVIGFAFFDVSLLAAFGIYQLVALGLTFVVLIRHYVAAEKFPDSVLSGSGIEAK